MDAATVQQSQDVGREGEGHETHRSTHDLNTDKRDDNIPMSDSPILSPAPPVSPVPVPVPVQIADNQASTTKSLGTKRKGGKCRYYHTKKGCRAGTECPFSHEDVTRARDLLPTRRGESLKTESSLASRAADSSRTISSPSNPPSKPAARPEVVGKPISSAENVSPRDFQIGQVKRRFSPTVKQDAQGTTILNLKLVPTDPDFPFELEALLCTLSVPVTYPNQANGKPWLRVTNPEMERGYQINVERGFNSLVERQSNRTLLALMNELDRNLESFLTPEKAQTLKLVANKGPSPPKHAVVAARVSPEECAAPQTVSIPAISRPAGITPTVPTFTAQQREVAAARRAADLRQLEGRLGRQALFSKSPDGVTFTVPIQPKACNSLPPSLQSIRSIKLIVPMSYHLDPCRIEFAEFERGEEARQVEDAFSLHAREHSEMNLMTQLNLLAVNMHAMAKIPEPAISRLQDPPAAAPSTSFPSTVPEMITTDTDKAEPTSGWEENDMEKPHIKVVPRPPEWTRREEDSDDEEETCSDTYDSEEEFSEDEAGGVPVAGDQSRSAPERGISLSFPYLELYGIELLELVSVSLIIRCDRCKETKDLKNIRTREPDPHNVKKESCTRCGNVLIVGYRREFMHHGAVRAGFLDLEGCTVMDLLPSNFIPTCSECSTAYPAPGLVSVRGDSPVAICRSCHRRMNFALPEVKFLVVSNIRAPSNRPSPRHKPKKDPLLQGIHAGTELPRKGRCNHYAKSYRWFRFTACCNKLYPCDLCHNAAEDHINDHAGRMICGHCSREQNFHPETCAHCHRDLVGRRSKMSGFWEGGKGTRDKVRMSRKERRKWRKK